MEDLVHIDDDIMERAKINMIHRKKLKAWIASGGPAAFKPKIRRKSITRVPVYTSASMTEVVEGSVRENTTQKSVTEDSRACIPSHTPPVPPETPGVVSDTNASKASMIDPCSDSSDDGDDEDEIDMGDDHDGIAPPPKKDGEKRTSWMAEMETLTRSDGAKKVVTTYTIRLADGKSYFHIVTIDFDGTKTTLEKPVPADLSTKSAGIPAQTSTQKLGELLHKIRSTNAKHRGSTRCISRLRHHSSDELGLLFKDLGLHDTADMIATEGVEGDDFVDFEDEDLESFQIPRQVFQELLRIAGGATPRSSALDMLATTENETMGGNGGITEKEIADSLGTHATSAVAESSSDGSTTAKKEKTKPLTGDDEGDGMFDEKLVIAKVTKMVAGSASEIVPSQKGFKSGDIVVITFGRRNGEIGELGGPIPPKVSEPNICRWSVCLESGRVVRYPETKLKRGERGRKVSVPKIKKNTKVRAMHRVRAEEGTDQLDMKKGDILMVTKILSGGMCQAMNHRTWNKGKVKISHLAVV